jgi:hypothetical protein
LGEMRAIVMDIAVKNHFMDQDRKRLSKNYASFYS